MRILFNSIVVIAAICFTYSCSKTTLVGSDLFVPDSIELFYKDDFEITAKTVRGDSVVTSEPATFLNSLVLGKSVDPIFGTTVAEAYIDTHLEFSLAPGFQYEDENGVMKTAILDSVVLVLAYSPTQFYADSTVYHNLTVNALNEQIPSEDTLYSTYTQGFVETPLVEKRFRPNYTDSIRIIEPGDTIATVYVEQLRVQLELPFFEELMADTMLTESDASFIEYMPGIRIESAPEGNSFIAFDLTKTSESPNNRIIMYYTKEEVQSTYIIILDGERSSYYNHDYSGSEIEPFFDDEEKGDSLLFLQGMAGSDVEISIPAFADTEFSNFIINKSELEFYVYEDENSVLYEPLESILLQRYNDDGNIVATSDVFLAQQDIQDESFGGLLTEGSINGMTLKKYTAATTIHTLSMFDGNNPDTRIRISGRNKRGQANRSIIFGPGHSQYPMKFKLTYSK